MIVPRAASDLTHGPVDVVGAPGCAIARREACASTDTESKAERFSATSPKMSWSEDRPVRRTPITLVNSCREATTVHHRDGIGGSLGGRERGG